MSYTIIAEPEGKNPGRLDQLKKTADPPPGLNDSGVVLYVVDERGNRREVSRVAFIRRNSKNPKTSFERQLTEELGRAREAVRVLNGLIADAGVLA